jgi:hypothetical protein
MKNAGDYAPGRDFGEPGIMPTPDIEIWSTAGVFLPVVDEVERL